jgi:hypothetical protein
MSAPLTSAFMVPGTSTVFPLTPYTFNEFYRPSIGVTTVALTTVYLTYGEPLGVSASLVMEPFIRRLLILPLWKLSTRTSLRQLPKLRPKVAAFGDQLLAGNMQVNLPLHLHHRLVPPVLDTMETLRCTFGPLLLQNHLLSLLMLSTALLLFHLLCQQQ